MVREEGISIAKVVFFWVGDLFAEFFMGHMTDVGFPLYCRLIYKGRFSFSNIFTKIQLNNQLTQRINILQNTADLCTSTLFKVR